MRADEVESLTRDKTLAEVRVIRAAFEAEMATTHRAVQVVTERSLEFHMLLVYEALLKREAALWGETEATAEAATVAARLVSPSSPSGGRLAGHGNAAPAKLPTNTVDPVGDGKARIESETVQREGEWITGSVQVPVLGRIPVSDQTNVTRRGKDGLLPQQRPGWAWTPEIDKQAGEEVRRSKADFTRKARDYVRQGGKVSPGRWGPQDDEQVAKNEHREYVCVTPD